MTWIFVIVGILVLFTIILYTVLGPAYERRQMKVEVRDRRRREKLRSEVEAEEDAKEEARRKKRQVL
jgi:hypothetical protein